MKKKKSIISPLVLTLSIICFFVIAIVIFILVINNRPGTNVCALDENGVKEGSGFEKVYQLSDSAWAGGADYYTVLKKTEEADFQLAMNFDMETYDISSYFERLLSSLENASRKTIPEEVKIDWDAVSYYYFSGDPVYFYEGYFPSAPFPRVYIILDESTGYYHVFKSL